MRRGDMKEGEAVFLALTEDYGKGKTDAAIADDVGVNARTIARWRSKRRVPDQKMDDIERFLGRHAIDWRTYTSRPRPVYDFDRDYWEAVRQIPHDFPALPAHVPSFEVSFLGMQLNSPIGVAASIATASSDWIEYWGRLHFDVLTYKSVRAVDQDYAPHQRPHVVYLPRQRSPWPVHKRPTEVELPNGPLEQFLEAGQPISLANSVGMPSLTPQEWMPDVDRAKAGLGPNQRLILSFVGTGSTDRDMLRNFVLCALSAAETKADFLELNASCPNVYATDGDKTEGCLYQDPKACGGLLRQITKALRDAGLSKPLLLKIGYLDDGPLEQLVRETRRYLAGYTAINTLATNIYCMGATPDSTHWPYFSRGGKAIAGVSGIAIRDHALCVVKRLNQIRGRRDAFGIIGVGGVATNDDVLALLEAGADIVQTCTAAMFDRLFAVKARLALAETSKYTFRGDYSPLETLRLADDPNYAKWIDEIREASYEERLDLRMSEIQQLILDRKREAAKIPGIRIGGAAAVRARRTEPASDYWRKKIGELREQGKGT